MTAYLAPALVVLRRQLDEAWPARDRTSDGWIGDAAHSSRVSDHNPDPTSDPAGIVRALDIDEDGIDTATVVLALITDPRTRYVIYEARIWARGTGTWTVYTGLNLHTRHIHVSVRDHSGYDTNRSPWALDTTLEEPMLTEAQATQLAAAAKDASDAERNAYANGKAIAELAGVVDQIKGALIQPDPLPAVDVAALAPLVAAELIKQLGGSQ